IEVDGTERGEGRVPELREPPAGRRDERRYGDAHEHEPDDARHPDPPVIDVAEERRHRDRQREDLEEVHARLSARAPTRPVQCGRSRMMDDTERLVEAAKAFIEQRADARDETLLEEAHPADMAAVFRQLPVAEQVTLFRSLSPERAAAVLP